MVADLFFALLCLAVLAVIALAAVLGRRLLTLAGTYLEIAIQHGLRRLLFVKNTGAAKADQVSSEYELEAATNRALTDARSHPDVVAAQVAAEKLRIAAQTTQLETPRGRKREYQSATVVLVRYLIHVAPGILCLAAVGAIIFGFVQLDSANTANRTMTVTVCSESKVAGDNANGNTPDAGIIHTTSGDFTLGNLTSGDQAYTSSIASLQAILIGGRYQITFHGGYWYMSRYVTEARLVGAVVCTGP